MASWIRAAMAAVAVLALCSLRPASARAEIRSLILAASYERASGDVPTLANTIRDGRAIASALRQAGLADVQLIEEPTAARWEEALARFEAGLSPDDIALVYYAGHALQVSGRNYFLAADGTTLIDIEQMLPRLQRARGTILIVDACRNNPFQHGTASETVAIARGDSRALQTVSIGELAASHRGLSQLGNLRGMSAIVLFSTEPGNVALDGAPGEGSPFALAVAAELRRRQSLNSAFRRISVAVNRTTEGAQSPWRQGDLPFDVYIAGMQNFPVP
jgi:uncharacterized caspase-like protein